MGKNFVLNADDFGMSKECNKAVLEGYNNGFLTSASLCANGNAFSAAVNDILPECPNLGIGVHLNAIEGKSLTQCALLTDKQGNFNAGYLYFMMNLGRKEFLEQLEAEFRAQIEQVLKYTAVDHIDSHVHTHAIPEIFKLVCKLALHYNIPCIRTQHEELYFVPNLMKHVNFKYPVNLLKVALLNGFTRANKKTATEFGLKTNDYLLGVGYTGMMDSQTVETGLRTRDKDCTVEALIHPCCYDSQVSNPRTVEFSIPLDKRLEDTIRRLGFEITNYKKLSL